MTRCRGRITVLIDFLPDVATPELQRLAPFAVRPTLQGMGDFSHRLIVFLTLWIVGCGPSLEVTRTGPAFPAQRYPARVIWLGSIAPLSQASHDILGKVEQRQEGCGVVPKAFETHAARKGQHLGGHLVLVECGAFAPDGACMCRGEVVRFRPGFESQKL